MPPRTAALLIDDDAKLGALVAEYLGRHEIDLTVAGNGERGLTALRRGRFDVVLLDVMLPRIDGAAPRHRRRPADGAPATSRWTSPRAKSPWEGAAAR